MTQPSEVQNRDLVTRVLERDRAALARTLTHVENGDAQVLEDVIGRLFQHTGGARLVGITGPPGVGKSTLTSRLTQHLRGLGRRVAVLAIDPSSPFTGGAVLGDRIRMRDHHGDKGVYIRSMASRGHLGGLASAAPQALIVLDAAGFDDIIIETVGVGQSEVEIAGAADTTIVALAPGAGDAVQAAKAGILEVADVFVINKADHDGAGRLESQLRSMLEVDHVVAAGRELRWTTSIVRTVAVRDDGIGEVVGAIDEHWQHQRVSGSLAEHRQQRVERLVRDITMAGIRRDLEQVGSEADEALRALGDKVIAGELDPYSAARELIGTLAPRSAP